MSPPKKRSTAPGTTSKLDAAWASSQAGTINQGPLWEATVNLAREASRKFFKEDFEDVAQEAVMDVWKGLASFKQNSKFSTWVWRVVVNRCKSELRKRQQIQRTVSLEELSAKDYSKLVAEPGRKIESQEAILGLRDGLKLLDTNLQTVVKMHLTGDSFQEIGTQLGISRESARQRWQAALRELKEHAQDV